MHVWRCFRETSLDDLKLVILGMSPYHTFKNYAPVADGLLMGCSVTNSLQPTLDQFYQGIERELYDGLNLSYYPNPDVTYLASQGVLMLNAALTVEMNKAGSHLEIWEPFMKYLFEEVISVAGVPILFLGKDASKYKKYTNIFSHNFIATHPASASYKSTEWDSENVFTKINTILKENNNLTVEWLDTGVPF